MRNPNLKRLTAGEQKALSLMLDFYRRTKRFPSLREQAVEAKYSHQNASQYRNSLSLKGWVKLDGQRNVVSAVQPTQGYRMVEPASE